MSAKNLNAAMKEIFRHEGGYVDHPNDPGGATNMGITRKTLARWREVKPWWKLPKSAVKSLNKSEAKVIYKARYWDRIGANSLPDGIDLALFDFAVNSGPSRAVKTLQAVLKVRRDGIVGPITLGAIARNAENIGTRGIIRIICRTRLSFLQRLKIFPTFGRGWKRRVASVERASLSLAKNSPQYRPITKPQSKTRKPNMNIFSGYKTYIVGAFMLLAAIGQIAGLDLPGFDGQSATQLMMEAFAIIFLRKGIKTEIGNA